MLPLIILAGFAIYIVNQIGLGKIFDNLFKVAVIGAIIFAVLHMPKYNSSGFSLDNTDRSPEAAISEIISFEDFDLKGSTVVDRGSLEGSRICKEYSKLWGTLTDNVCTDSEDVEYQIYAVKDNAGFSKQEVEKDQATTIDLNNIEYKVEIVSTGHVGYKGGYFGLNWIPKLRTEPADEKVQELKKDIIEYLRGEICTEDKYNDLGEVVKEDINTTLNQFAPNVDLNHVNGECANQNDFVYEVQKELTNN